MPHLAQADISPFHGAASKGNEKWLYNFNHKAKMEKERREKRLIDGRVANSGWLPPSNPLGGGQTLNT